MGRMAGKVAFITGAARGQGRSHALRLAEEGADIIGIDGCREIPGTDYPMATLAELAETAKEVEARGRRAFFAAADVRDATALDTALAEGVDQLGPLDAVVANAGIAHLCRDGTLGIEPGIWQTVLDINLTGVWQTCRAAIRHLGDGGAIVLISSAAGLKGYANIGHYVAAKHGVTGLMRTLATELGPRGIRVNSVHPSQVPTDMIMNDSIIRQFVPDQEEPTIDEFAEASRRMHLLPIPWLEAEDISNAVLFLVSSEARYITGVALPVDGGVQVR